MEKSEANKNLSKKVILLHNFDKQEILKSMKLLKELFSGEDIIFASTTPTSLQWKLEDLLQELHQEHEEFKKIKEAKASLKAQEQNQKSSE
ncbi:MAG: DUF3783 domain-containing protein [Fervidobacterium sp.]